jgi:predicted acyltransferase (DUF342 family)
MAQTLRLKRSSVAGRVPTTASLQTGEIAINTADGLVYIRKDDNTIIPLIGVNTAAVTGSVVLLGSITATSFTGSFAGNFSGSINATLSKSASNGAGIATFTFDGSNNVTISLDTGSAHFTSGVNNLIAVGTALSASFATSASLAQSASFAQTAVTASYALVAQQLLGLNTGSFVTTGSISNATITLNQAGGTSFNLTVNNVANATSASLATTASYATVAQNVLNLDTGSLLQTGSVSNATITLTKANGTSFPLTVNNVQNATSASFATTASYTLVAQTVLSLDTGSFVTTGSVSNATLTFTQADQTTFNLTVNNVQNADSASFATTAQTALNVNTGSLLVTASIFDATITLQKGNGSTFDLVVNNVNNAASASYATVAVSVLNLPTGSFVTTGSVNNATLTFTQADQTTFDLTVNNVQSASYAATASSADAFTVRNDATVLGNLTVAGKVTAEEFHTEFVSSSIIYSSGSTKFGDTLDDIHQFTGSVQITGSLTAPDITINQWGSVSASLASINSNAQALTLQDVTDNGNITTNSISISSSLNVSQSIYSRGEEVLDFAVAMAIALG